MAEGSSWFDNLKRRFLGEKGSNPSNIQAIDASMGGQHLKTTGVETHTRRDFLVHAGAATAVGVGLGAAAQAAAPPEKIGSALTGAAEAVSETLKAPFAPAPPPEPASTTPRFQQRNSSGAQIGPPPSGQAYSQKGSAFENSTIADAGKTPTPLANKP